MSVFERWLTLWVALCILVGIGLGEPLPGLFAAIAALEVARVNLPVAVLIWLMIVPMLLEIDLAALGRVGQRWRGVAVTLTGNRAIKPFSMALLGWLFLGWLFRPLLPADQVESYIAGPIILAAAPCTAMVFVWSNLSDGEPHITSSQVALNDVIMVFAFAPIVGLLLGLSAITVPWETLLLSVVLYIVVPVLVAQALRARLLARGGAAALRALLEHLQPVSLLALLATLVLLFGFQGPQILAQPLVIALVAVAILVGVGAVVWEAVDRLAAPPPVPGGVVLAVALVGIAVDAGTALLFREQARHDLNARGAFLHMAADAAVSLGVVLAAGLILATGLDLLDPIVAILVSLIVAWTAFDLLRASLGLSFDAVPRGIQPRAVRDFLAARPGVREVHDLHIWPSSTTATALTAHLVMPGGHPGDAFLTELAHELEERFGIVHPTVQIETGDGAACRLAPEEVI